MTLVVIALMALLAASLYYAYGIWTTLGAADLPGWMYAAMIGGVLFSLLVGGGLMGLVFYSARAGYDDWRLPNMKELRSIVERSCVEPGLDRNIFLNAPGSPATLTSSTYPAFPQVAWTVGFDSGGYVASFGKGLNHRVRLVRGGDGFATYDADVVFADGFDGATP